MCHFSFTDGSGQRQNEKQKLHGGLTAPSLTWQGALCVCVCVCVQPCLTVCDPVGQAPLSLGFPRQEYWSGLPCPHSRDLPHTGTKPASPASLALVVGFFTSEQPGQGAKAQGKASAVR